MAENNYIIHQNDTIIWNDSDTKNPIFTLDEAGSKLLKFPLNTVRVYKVEEVKPTIVIEAASASTTATTTTQTSTSTNKDATSSGDTSSTKPTT